MIPSSGQYKGLNRVGSEGLSAAASIVGARAAPVEKENDIECELVSVLDSMEGGVLLLNMEGRVRFTNARFAQLFDLTPEVVAAAGDYGALARLIQGRLRVPGALVARWRPSAEDGPTVVHDELELAGPAHRVYQRSSRRVRNVRGERIGSLEIYRDVSDRRQLQTKMFQTEKMAALGQLVSGIAHELNNPLTGIMGYAQLLLRHGLHPAQLDEARKIYREAGRARRIVKNLLFFAREAQPERSRVDLNEIIERTLALRAYELKIENIVVKCSLQQDLRPTLADPYQLQQVVLNLLVNAEQAILDAHGCGRIFIRSSEEAGNHLRLEVADDGPGVAPEITSRIFDPFFTTKLPGVGTGLGLSIVYGIVQQHGGEVTLENRSGGGARFLVDLPIVNPAVAEASPVEFLPAAVPSEGLAGRLLVVEDEATVAQLIADVLREEGHHVDVVLDSHDGLTCVSRTRYDLIICDLRMPRLDGPAFYDALVRTGSPMKSQILFVTGDTLAPRTMEFLEAHALPYLAKPFLVEELKLAVNEQMQQTRNARESGATQTPQRHAGLREVKEVAHRE